MDPFMIYNGYHLFHYTSFEAALKICASQSLRFGTFSKMNDIAEVSRNIAGNVPIGRIEEELAKYKSISFTYDKPQKRGFTIDPLWGHYAEKGYGVCLVFNRKKIVTDLAKQYGNRALMHPISYLPDVSNALFFESMCISELEKEIEQDIEDIFFTKSSDWEYEHEERILLKSESNGDEFLVFESDALIAAILCLPRVELYKQSTSFKILKSVIVDKPILHYTGSLGGYTLFDEDNNAVCGIIGKDVQLDI